MRFSVIPFSVIPAKAGMTVVMPSQQMDSGFRRNGSGDALATLGKHGNQIHRAPDAPTE